MEYPARSKFATFDDFDAAFSVWSNKCKRVENRILGLYRVTKATEEKPEFAKRANTENVCHVDLAEKPDGKNLTVAISSIAGYVLAKDGHVTRVAHGVHDGSWCLWSEFTVDSDEDIAA